eukprot:SAG11_NODE_402_length_9751_cov_7.372047_9_plen_558_part_00
MSIIGDTDSATSRPADDPATVPLLDHANENEPLLSRATQSGPRASQVDVQAVQAPTSPSTATVAGSSIGLRPRHSLDTKTPIGARFCDSLLFNPGTSTSAARESDIEVVEEELDQDDSCTAAVDTEPDDIMATFHAVCDHGTGFGTVNAPALQVIVRALGGEMALLDAETMLARFSAQFPINLTDREACSGHHHYCSSPLGHALFARQFCSLHIKRHNQCNNMLSWAVNSSVCLSVPSATSTRVHNELLGSNPKQPLSRDQESSAALSSAGAEKSTTIGLGVFRRLFEDGPDGLMPYLKGAWRARLYRISHLRRAFDAADVDRNNAVTRQELELLLLATAPDRIVAAEEVDAVWSQLTSASLVKSKAITSLSWLEFLSASGELENSTDTQFVIEGLESPTKFELLSLIIDLDKVDKHMEEKLLRNMSFIEKTAIHFLETIQKPLDQADLKCLLKRVHRGNLRRHSPDRIRNIKAIRFKVIILAFAIALVTNLAPAIILSGPCRAMGCQISISSATTARRFLSVQLQTMKVCKFAQTQMFPQLQSTGLPICRPSLSGF